MVCRVEGLSRQVSQLAIRNNTRPRRWPDGVRRDVEKINEAASLCEADVFGRIGKWPDVKVN